MQRYRGTEAALRDRAGLTRRGSRLEILAYVGTGRIHGWMEQGKEMLMEGHG